MLNIAGLNKADVLAALYNASRPQGMGFMQYDPAAMTHEEAARLLAAGDYFDYLKGRVMKVSLKSDEEFREELYDRDNGDGAAARAIETLRKTGNTNTQATQAIHEKGKAEAAATTMNYLHEETRTETTGSVAVMRLGSADVADKLRPAVERATKQGR